MRCSKCGAENPDRAKFCVECASPFARRCSSCGAENPPHAKFCLECSQPLRSAGAQSPSAGQSANSPIHLSQGTADASLEGERKTVTALFADIKGSTELEQDLDPEEARAIIDPALKLMIEAVRRYDGYIVQSTGDGIFALFGAPVAHEDHPQRALYAALRMQEEVRRYADKLRADGRSPLQIRIGADTGEVVVRTIETGGKTEYSPIGHAANLASRMQSLANPGSTVVSESTRKLTEGYFALKSLGPSRVRGITEPINVYEVTGFGPLRTRLQRSAGRGLTKFVGREREMDAMRHAAELAQSGRGQIVAAVAEAGVGKSRLFHEFKVKNRSGWMVLETVSVSHGKASAYLPVIDLLHSYFDIKPDDDSRKRREKVNGRIITLDPALEDTRPHLFGLLGLVEGEDPLAQMDAQIRRRRTQDAVKRILLRESLNQPLMVEFEDLHWIDDETQVLLNLLADSIGTSRVLLLVNYRPEYSHSWGNKTYYTQLRLDPLGKESADEMLSTLLGSDASLAPLKRLIAEKTEGNPLFMEEIYLSLLEDGTLARNGGVKLVKPLASLRVPPTIQGILASRIDRLPADEKELLQMVAVLGTEFQLGVARALSGKSDDDLNRMLNDLQMAEFIYEQPSAGAVEYSFKHALTHDVALKSVLQERRKLLHERAGAAIESLFAGDLDDHVAELAHHFTQSGNPSKAARYLMLAGKQSLERAAFAESHAQLQRGLEWVERVADEIERARLELKLQLGLCDALRYFTGPASPELTQAAHRAEELCERVGTDEERFTVLRALRGALLFSGNLEAATEKCRLALELAERTGNAEMVATANAIMANTILPDRPAEALRLARRALGTTQANHEQPRNFARGRFDPTAGLTAAFALLWLGYPDQAERVLLETLDTVRQTNPLRSGPALASLLYATLKNPNRVLDLVRPVLVEAEQAGLVFERARGSAALGWAIARKGDPDRGIAMIRAAENDMRATGTGPFQGAVLVLPDALLNAARYDETIATVNEILGEAAFRNHTTGAELHRVKGEAILGRDPSATADAEACFRKAIEAARGQSARWYELRATVSLGRLLARTGRRGEARAMLAEIYNWFTEGFDTADLKAAKALLDELNT